MRYPLLAILLLLPGLLVQCQHTTPAPQPAPDPLTLLPPATQTGANTMGCLVNGKAYATVTSVDGIGDLQTPSDLGVGGSLRADADLQGAIVPLGLLLHGKLQTSQVFSLVSFDVKPGSANTFIGYSAPLQGTCRYEGKHIKTGQVTLTKFDGPARIAAGRFNLVLYEPGGCDTLRITNGRFDERF